MHLDYPAARVADVVEELHGERVADPYRWLEDTDSAETRAWIEAENTLSEAWLDEVPTRAEIRKRMTELWDYPKVGLPFERGGQWFQWRQDGLANQPVLYVMAESSAIGRVLLDPNLLSADGTVAVTDITVSPDGRLLAWATSVGGSDWRTWRIRNVSSGEDLPDVLKWSKFTPSAFFADGSGLFYGVFEPPAAGQELLEASGIERIALHRIGTTQQEDEIIWSRPDEPEWIPHVEITEDGRYLIISIGHGTRPENLLHILDLEEPGIGFRALLEDFTTMAGVVGNEGKTFYLLTDYEAERNRLVAVSLDAPSRANWRDLVAEQSDILLDASYYGGRLICHHLHNAQSRLSVHSTTGALLHEIKLPPGRFVSGTSGRPEASLVHLSTVGFTDSGTTWSHELKTATTQLVRAPSAPIDADAFVTELVAATSEDGTRVPLFLTRRRDLVPTGAVPTLLTGYGGFNVAETPRFSVSQALWVERGGILATAILRGGGEYGRAWYEAGRLANKQNVFDDFCACARYLASSGWSKPERIAITGRSNGGLLVGACLTQHPELFGAAVPEVGVLDLLRYHRFTIGWAWTSDYGDPADPEQYAWVRAYSPLHNIRPGTHYPPTLITTGDHDDRVVPGHSFKFAAALQAAQVGEAPVLIRIETAAGHGMGKPTTKAIEERSDVLTFLERALGIVTATS